MVAEQAGHLLGRLEVALGVGEQQGCRLGDPRMLADAGDHVLQRPAVGVVVVDVVGRERPGAGGGGELGEPGQALGVVAGVAMRQDEIELPPAPPQPAGQLGEGRIRRVGRQKREHLPLVMGQHILQRQGAAGLGRPQLAVGQERAEPRIGRFVGGPAEQRGAADKVEPAADQEAQARFLGLLMRPDDAGEAVAVGEREAGETQGLGLYHQLLGMRGAPQEAEVRGDLQLGVGGHGAPAMISRTDVQVDEEPVDVGEEIGGRGESAPCELGVERLVPGEKRRAQQVHGGDVEAVVDRVIEFMGEAQGGVEQRLAGQEPHPAAAQVGRYSSCLVRLQHALADFLPGDVGHLDQTGSRGRSSDRSAAPADVPPVADPRSQTI